MSNKVSAGLLALKGLEDSPPEEVAGKVAVGKKSSKLQKEKSSFVGVRMTQREEDKADKLAIRLSKKGVQVSKGNALRMALHYCNPTDTELQEFADLINKGDGRKSK